MKKEDKDEHINQDMRRTMIEKVATTTTKSEEQQYLEEQLKITLKKLANARELCAAQEKAVRDAKTRERKAYNQCQTFKYKYEKTKEKLDVMERHLKMKRLRESCHKTENIISAKQSRCHEIEFDDMIHLPIKTDKRIELMVLKKSLNRSEKIHESQKQLLYMLEKRQNLDFEMKSAAIEGNVTRIKELVALGVSVNFPDETGMSPFKYACGQGHINAVREMVPVADVHNKDGYWPPLHVALEKSQPQIVEILIQNNANVDDPDETGEAPLHIACRKNSLECVSTLIREGGASINVQNNLGDTCLHYCARTNQYEIASFLLENGANLNLKNVDRLTPLIVAKTKRNYEVLKVFNRDSLNLLTDLTLKK